jgi:adenylate kinase
MRVVLLQPPVFRRETPADSLAGALAVPRVHFGDLIRAHLTRGTGLGIRAAGIISSGGPFPDETITAIVRDHLHREGHRGFLLTGYPQSATQALALDELLRELGRPLDGVLHLRQPEVEADVEPEAEVEADVEPEAECDDGVRDRLRAYEAMLEPVIRYYARQDLLVTVDAVGPPDEVAGRALTALRVHGC